MKTVDYREYNRALKELRAELQVQTGGLNVELCEMNGCEQPVQLGVNWAGIGTVSVDKAKDFATAIPTPPAWPRASFTPVIWWNTNGKIHLRRRKFCK